MKVYYAHHTWKYGTPIELFETECIRKFFGSDDLTVINPKDAVSQDKNETEIMEDCYSTINDCDALVFSTFSGMIGHGVFNEIIYALNCGKKVYHLHGIGCYEIYSLELFMNEVVADFIFRGDNRLYAILNSPF